MNIFVLALIFILVSPPRRKDPLDFTAQCVKKSSYSYEEQKKKRTPIQILLFLLFLNQIVRIQNAVSNVEHSSSSNLYLLYIPVLLLLYYIMYKMIEYILFKECNSTMVVFVLLSISYLYSNMINMILYSLERIFNMQKLLTSYYELF
jgi:hypothetical protein